MTISETLYAELQMLTAGAVGVSVLCPGWVRTQIHRSDRNRPDELQDEAPNSFADEEGGARSMLEGLIAGGLEADEVAQLVLDGIADDRFYLFTHDEWSPMVERRASALVAGENPIVGPPPGVPTEGAPGEG
ncbi:hypothetical protein B7486_68685 [cyanobacterium TDX16]|nr:hypothetical protein B7486_68685 [cyanobacterium TDX16]